MEYTELIPNLRWNSPIYNNINLLILSHPKQEFFFTSHIEEFIWSRFPNTTIWNIQKDISNEKHLIEEVKQMDATICYITELFLVDSNIADRILEFIIRNNYLLLPIFNDQKLETVFNDRYGHIQFVKGGQGRYFCFDEIEKFLKKIKPREEKKYNEICLLDKSLKNFSQSYFISYRKKDGRYVDYIQRKIHQELEFFDTQLWYDSYLPPGENFDENLKRAIDNCTAVILLVTPNLFEVNNYVLEIEIPYARSCQKSIIAILMENTDLAKLKIEKAYKLEEWESFKAILEDAGVAIPNTKPYPRHLVQIGITYMKGEEVERNIDIACELFYQAVQYQCLEAYEKLIEIKTGEFEDKLNVFEEVANSEENLYKDIEEAIALFQNFIQVLKTRYHTSRSKKNLIKLLEYLRKYGEFCFNEELFEEAHFQFSEMYNYTVYIEEQEVKTLYTYRSTACLLIGKTFDKCGNYKKAEEFYRKSVDIDRVLNDGDLTSNSITYTNFLTSLYELGKFLQNRSELLKAKIVYQEILVTIQNNRTAYGKDWKSDVAYIGYVDVNAAMKTERFEQYARSSLRKLESILEKLGKYRPEVKNVSRSYITDSRILRQDQKEKIQLLSHQIMINNLNKMRWLVEYLAKIDLDFDICQKKYCVNAKSLLAIMSLDINDVCELIIHSVNFDMVDNILRKIVTELNN